MKLLILRFWDIVIFLAASLKEISKSLHPEISN